MVSLYTEFERVAKQYADRPAIVAGEETYTYGRLLDEVRILSRRLKTDSAFRLQTGDAVVLISENCIRWPLASLAIQAAGAVEYPRETTLDAAGVASFCERSGARLVFLQNARHLEWFVPAKAQSDTADRSVVENIILMEDATSPSMHGNTASEFTRVWYLKDLVREDECSGAIPTRPSLDIVKTVPVKPGDSQDAIAAVIRTSGTTGDPKFVELSHRNFLHGMRCIPERLDLRPSDRFLSCLPPWHLFARIEHYAAFSAGAALHYCEFEEISVMLRRVRPTIFPGFPEIWERIYHSILLRIHEGGMLQRAIFYASLDLSIRYYRNQDQLAVLENAGAHQVSRSNRLAERVARHALDKIFYPLQRLADRFVFTKIRAELGGQLRAAIIGDSPLPVRIDESLRAFGIPVLEGYGSTEQCVTTLRSIHRNAIGAAGAPLPETQVVIRSHDGTAAKIGQNGEILVRGPQVFTRYFYLHSGHGNELTKAFCQLDGLRYYITGDVGLITPAGNLQVLGRKANEFALSDGTRVNPEGIENELRTLPYIDRVIVVGLGQPSTMALILPDFAELIRYLRDQAPKRLRRLTPPRLRRLQPHRLKNSQRDQKRLREILIRMPVIQLLFIREAGRLLKSSDLAPTQIPDRIRLLDQPFERGRELTPTLKPRRRVIESLYAREIAAAYDPAGPRGVFYL